VVKIYAECARIAANCGLGVNAGHDLSLKNIQFFKEQVPELLEVSIGHALITEALYMGLETTIQKYLKLLK
jgi:pyridoxine 5-phosphate synthase